MKKGNLLNKKTFRNPKELYEFEKLLQKIVMKRLKITIHPRNKSLNKLRKISNFHKDFRFQIFTHKTFGIVSCCSCKQIKNSLPYHKKLCKQCYSGKQNEAWDTW